MSRIADKIVCLVPLRGGSKSIPRKNILPFRGKPLACWTLEAALACPEIAEVWVSTDSEEIREVVAAHLPAVRFCRRDPATATDEASTESVMLDFMAQVEFDVLVTAQATSPGTRASDFSAAIAKFRAEGADSLLTGVREKRFYWSLDGVPLNYDPRRRPRRQDFDGTIVENGAFYITRRLLLETEKCRLGGKIVIHEMASETFDEIDEPSDWAKMERAAGASVSSTPRTASAAAGRDIRLLVCDVDGTLTDGGMYYSAEGDSLRKFNTRDAHGMADLRKRGIEVILLSAEDTGITRARARKLGIEGCHLGVKDKPAFMRRLLAEKGLGFEQVAYIGDDVNDLECILAAGLGACPADACSAVLRAAPHIMSKPGGAGAVREFCELIESNLSKPSA